MLTCNKIHAHFNPPNSVLSYTKYSELIMQILYDATIYKADHIGMHLVFILDSFSCFIYIKGKGKISKFTILCSHTEATAVARLYNEPLQ